MLMKQILLLAIIALYTLNCLGQTLDDITYVKTSKEYFVEFIKNKDKYTFSPFNLISVADTANFKLYLPILLLEEASDTLLNYQRISPYIDKKFSPHNQRVFISNPNGVFIFSVIKGIYEKSCRNSLTPQLLLSIPEKFMMGVSDRNPNLASREFSFADKKITYERIQNYVDCHPDTKLFTIEELPGIWGYKNDRLIKLIFDRKEVREMDGEEYYRTYLFPLSPKGIKRVTRSEKFIKIIVI